jgi:hypothetical protein
VLAGAPDVNVSVLAKTSSVNASLQRVELGRCAANAARYGLAVLNNRICISVLVTRIIAAPAAVAAACGELLIRCRREAETLLHRLDCRRTSLARDRLCPWLALRHCTGAFHSVGALMASRRISDLCSSAAVVRSGKSTTKICVRLGISTALARVAYPKV